MSSQRLGGEKRGHPLCQEKMLAEKLEEQTRVCREPAGDKKMRNK